jgi:predicted acylesterase/phospholipase RssA
MNSSLKSLLVESSEELPVRDVSTDPRPIFLAMQGGGAKGIAHVGALTAIEKFEYEIRGVSGTSAGSMVAALVAAGYKAEELVNLETREHFFSHNAEELGFDQPTAIFPGNGWRSLRRWRSAGQRILPFIRWLISFKTSTKKLLVEDSASQTVCLHIVAKKPGFKTSKFRGALFWAKSGLQMVLNLLGVLLRVSAALCWFSVRWFLPFTILFLLINYFIQRYPVLTALVTTALVMSAFLYSKWVVKFVLNIIGGMNDVANISLLIDRAISLKLKENGYPNEGGITFEMLSKANGTIPLKIVATNVAHECLELFCLDRTPYVKIGDAVAASVCLPFVFKPWNLGGRGN